jgi:hypothetical protein
MSCFIFLNPSINFNFPLIKYMGNLLATFGTIGVPLFNHLVTIPFIYHPYRWGGVPWKAPGWLQLAIVTFIANVTLLLLISTLGGIMSTKQACDKYDVWLSLKRSIWKLLGYFIGSAVLSVASSIKGPFLVWLSWMPYANWIVHGALVAIPILFLGAMGTNLLRTDVCAAVKP